MELLASFENWPVSVWVRESGSLFAYPTILFLHTVGLAIVVGLSAAVALRALGFAPGVAIGPLQRYYRTLWAGFWLNAISGTLLLLADATTKFVNPVFYVKMALVLLAMIATIALRRRLAAASYATRPSMAKLLAVATLALWTGAITAGRLMAYLGPVSGAPGLENTLGH